MEITNHWKIKYKESDHERQSKLNEKKKGTQFTYL